MQAVVFDMDGVLLDSEPLHGMALREACATVGLVVDPEEVVGVADRDVILRAAFRAGRELEAAVVDRLLVAKMRLVQALCRRDLVMPYQGAVELFHAAGEAAAVGVCTAAMRQDVMFLLGRIGLNAAEHVVVTADDVGQTKPRPECYLLAAERLRVEPGRSVAIEDSVSGVAAAKAAGFRVVAVGHTTAPEKLAAADVFVPTIAELTVERLRRIVG